MLSSRTIASASRNTSPRVGSSIDMYIMQQHQTGIPLAQYSSFHTLSEKREVAPPCCKLQYYLKKANCFVASELYLVFVITNFPVESIWYTTFSKFVRVGCFGYWREGNFVTMQGITQFETRDLTTVPYKNVRVGKKVKDPCLLF